MGCLFRCFRSSKHKKSGDQTNETCETVQPVEPIEKGSDNAIQLVKDSKDEGEEQINGISSKKVAFDLNVTRHEELSTQEAKNFPVECEKEKEEEKRGETENEACTLSKSDSTDDESEDRYIELVEKGEIEKDQAVVVEENSESLFSLSIESTKQVSSYEAGEKEVNSPIAAAIHGLPDGELEPIGLNQSATDSAESLDSSKSLFSLSVGSKQQVSASGAGEKEVNGPIAAAIHDLPDQEIKPIGLNQGATDSAKSLDSSESLFSLSTGSGQQASASEAGEKEVTSPMKIHGWTNQKIRPIGLNQTEGERRKYVGSVLNMVENLTQWRAAKERRSTPLKKDQEKENISTAKEISIPFSAEEPSFKSPIRSSRQRSSCSKREGNEIAVDTSLSSWLVESETTPASRNSPNSVGNSPVGGNAFRSYEDRPILGALTIEELKQLSASSSPKRSPGHSPDEMAIIGTVGSYWSLTAQALDSYSPSSCKGKPCTIKKNRELCRIGE
ncbi:uncharacterized protein LOC127798300 isoform X2 [Diospyros lotus]|uniref:uncharacterized protein LOC127798300 isoform X2 n=1 Tax=Diospyros lotus TaxID=55363 RepID=UPI002257FFBE|nr:uncharacterized protein LOC127798300 isoform X2 [Diospyros lotus]